MIYLIGGARPNFMKIAALSRAFEKDNLEYEIIHTGQHYDYNMNKVFFDEFDLKDPIKHLEVGSGNHGEQTGKIMIKLEAFCINNPPDLMMVVGDVNSTMAAALVASKLHIPIAHQEAGMRSGDRSMPEEINRIVTDSISDYLFPIAYNHKTNLLQEGIPERKIFLVGDCMTDNLLYYIKDDKADKKHILVELHRPANVDDKDKLKKILKTLRLLATKYPVIFTVHPRTKKMIERFNLESFLDNVKVLEPLGYFDFHKLMNESILVITDSDGIQQETSILNIPCVAIRDTTNIAYTVEYGTTTLVEPDDQLFYNIMESINNHKEKKFPLSLNRLNDGKASERISKILEQKLKG